MLIAGYEFSDPKSLDGTNWNEVPAVYVVLDEENAKVDVGETGNLKDRLANHERRSCWERSCDGEILVAAKVEEDEVTRQKIESEIRETYDLPCGEE